QKCWDTSSSGLGGSEDRHSDHHFVCRTPLGKGHLEGDAACRTAPISDVSYEHGFCNDEKLRSGSEYDAVGQLIGKLITDTPNHSYRTGAHIVHGGHPVWGKA